ncbi:MAG: type IV pilus biogenesis protein PilM [bacterium]
MAQEENTGILGISLVDDQLRIVEGRKESANEFQVTHLAQGRVRQPFNFEIFSDRNMPRRFAEDITRLCQTQDFGVKDVAFSLDSRMVLVKKVAVDQKLEASRLGEHIGWEVEQFAISPIQEYVVDYEPLNGSTNGPLSSMLVVVVRKKVIRFLKQLFKHTDLRLRVVDVDIFSAQRALQLNYDYTETDKICLINVAEQKVHFTILKGKNFFLAQDIAPPHKRSFARSSESTARSISKELRRIILDHQLGKSVEDLSEIFLYGEAVEDGVLEGLQKSYDLRIDRANPFRKIKLPPQAQEDVSQARTERYMISVGAALRGIQ